MQHIAVIVLVIHSLLLAVFEGAVYYVENGRDGKLFSYLYPSELFMIVYKKRLPQGGGDAAVLGEYGISKAVTVAI